MNKQVDVDIRNKLQEAKNVLIVAHIRPDGDAVGSLLGLGTALLDAKKNVQMVLQDGVPEKYLSLPNADLVRTTIKRGYDLSVIVDSSDLERAGTLFENLPRPDICIDHHKTNELFAQINLVEDEAASTAEMLAAHIPVWGFEISQTAASCLLTGIISDTIGYRTSSVTSSTLRVSADLVDLGANMPDLYRQTLVDRSYEAMRLWGRGLDRIVQTGNIVWTSLTLDDKIISNYDDNDDADLINVLSAIDRAKIAIIFVEQDGGKVKVSWRSKGTIDVSRLAVEFGGGGHKAAAGADIHGELSEVIDSVIKASQTL